MKFGINYFLKSSNITSSHLIFDPNFREHLIDKLSMTFYVGFQVFMAVTMKNTVFWDIKTQFVPLRKHISATEPNR
jgi:hypothetical protein